MRFRPGALQKETGDGAWALFPAGAVGETRWRRAGCRARRTERRAKLKLREAFCIARMPIYIDYHVAHRASTLRGNYPNPPIIAPL